MALTFWPEFPDEFFNSRSLLVFIEPWAWNRNFLVYTRHISASVSEIKLNCMVKGLRSCRWKKKCNNTHDGAVMRRGPDHSMWWYVECNAIFPIVLLIKQKQQNKTQHITLNIDSNCQCACSYTTRVRFIQWNRYLLNPIWNHWLSSQSNWYSITNPLLFDLNRILY